MENDVIAGDDDQYTNGLKLIWSWYGLSELPEDAWAHRWLYPVVRKLGFGNGENSEKALTVSIGQNIYTPRDIESTELVRDDRPYAGITYMEIGGMFTDPSVFHVSIDFFGFNSPNLQK